MNEKKYYSSIGDHKKRKGTLYTPLNYALGDVITLTSWAKDRMPEYLWLGLILLHYGRKDGLERAASILLEIAKNIDSLVQPRISEILSLVDEQQEKIYEIIIKNIDKEVIAPLTALFSKTSYPLFFRFFCITHLSLEERLQLISRAIEAFTPPQSNEATDLRFLVVSFSLFSNKLKLEKEMESIITSLKEYAYIDHDDERMHLYRPTVRSLEGGMALIKKTNNFSSKFWKEIGMITKCDPISLLLPENEANYKEFSDDCRKVLENLFVSNKERSLIEDKFDVVVGSVNYALKIFEEINEKSLGNSILGRHGIRTIIEIYIMIKYLLKREFENPKIWKEYKLYGISKYKLILLKARESDMLDKESHYKLPILDSLVNEIMGEEFINIDLTYFDRHGIRDKSIDVNEKELYDIFYDYDSSFSHGLWGAIRESAMLHCNNANHQYHTVPDIYNGQNLADVKSDCNKVMIYLYSLLADIYQIPNWFVDKYQITKRNG